MHNDRNAGRKAIISEDDFEQIIQRIDTGEKLSLIAKEYGVSRQSLYKRINQYNLRIKSKLSISYMVNGNCTTLIEADPISGSVAIINYSQRLSSLAFGANSNPQWKNFVQLMEGMLEGDADREVSCPRFYVNDRHGEGVTLGLIEAITKDCERSIKCNGESSGFSIDAGDLVYVRTDTDGYQLKSVSKDRKYFVKAQAIIGGLKMDDWAVEIIASDLCKQLGIAHVRQYECDFIYGNRSFKGVFSRNFELDGYTFISFESLLQQMGLSSNDDVFIRLDAADKLKWCAQKLADAGNIPYDDTLKYMLNLALIDCLVGNVDRHTRNFGLFFDVQSGSYTIPLIFDNGMGLFQHDPYRDKYGSFSDAMRNVYIAPYGEDPFDMCDILESEFDITSAYPQLAHIEYKLINLTANATEYIERMKRRWQK